MTTGLVSFKNSNTRHIIGKVSAKDDGQPIPGVTINVEGTNIGAQTNQTGDYSIDVPDGKSYLIFSFVGYQTQKVKISKSDRLNVQLLVSQNNLQEVVVTGYGIKRSRNTVGYSTAKVAYKDLNGVSPNISNKMSGKAYGLSVSSASPASTPKPQNSRQYNNYGYNGAPDDESYKPITENPFLSAKENPLSTFSIDVDEASYSNVRRFINNGQLPPVDAVRIEEMNPPVDSYSNELMTVKFRYKQPGSNTSKLSAVSVSDKPVDFSSTSNDFRFASAVAEFGMLLRGSEYKHKGNFDQAIKIAKRAKGKDDDGYRSEFIRLAESTKSLAANGQLITEE